MAVFSLGSGTELNNLDDISKVKSYLFQLTEQLRYMFNNLDPQDNYSEMARLTVVSDGERTASIEASLDAIRLTYVSKDGIVSAINLSEEQIQIEASKIKLEGLVTVNGYFQVGLDGSIRARNGEFAGSIYGSDITLGGVVGEERSDGYLVVLDRNGDEIGHWDHDGFSVNKGVISLLWGNEVGVYMDGSRFQVGDWKVDNSYGRSILQSVDEKTGMSADPTDSDGLYFWAGWNDDDDYVFQVGQGDAYVMYNGRQYEIGKSISDLNDTVRAYSSGGDGPYDEPTQTRTGHQSNEEAFTANGVVYDDVTQQGGS